MASLLISLKFLPLYTQRCGPEASKGQSGWLDSQIRRGADQSSWDSQQMNHRFLVSRESTRKWREFQTVHMWRFRWRQTSQFEASCNYFIHLCLYFYWSRKAVSLWLILWHVNMLLGLLTVGNWQNKVWMVFKKKKCCTFSDYKDGVNIYLESYITWRAAVQYWNKEFPIRFVSGFLSVHFFGTITDVYTERSSAF